MRATRAVSSSAHGIRTWILNEKWFEKAEVLLMVGVERPWKVNIILYRHATYRVQA